MCIGASAGLHAVGIVIEGQQAQSHTTGLVEPGLPCITPCCGAIKVTVAASGWAAAIAEELKQWYRPVLV